MDSTIPGAATDSTPRTGSWRQRAAGVIGAVLAAVVIWVIAVPIADVTLTATMGSGNPPMEINLGSVIFASLLISLLGWGLLALLERVSSRGTQIWTVIAVIVLILSLGGPLAADSTSATITLMLMHLAVGAVLIWTMTRRARS